MLVAAAPGCHVCHVLTPFTRPQVIERFTLEDLPAENGQDSCDLGVDLLKRQITSNLD